MTQANSVGSSVIPALRYQDAHAAIDFLKQAFGFTTKEVHEGPNNTIAHAELTLGAGMIMLGSASNAGPDNSHLAHPSEIGARNTQSVYLVVPDAAAISESAQAAGARIASPIAEMPYGGKAFSCFDLEGHLWSVGEYNPWPETEG